jgi:hypothetical protein
MAADSIEQATFFRAALLLGLIRGERVVAWADAVIAMEPSPPEAFTDLATTPPDDLTMLRQRLLAIGREKESEGVVRALAGLVHRDLASSRRTLGDTMTVLKQLRAFVAVGSALNEQIKTLGVDVAMAPPNTPERAAAEERVRAWLALHERDAGAFLE